MECIFNFSRADLKFEYVWEFHEDSIGIYNNFPSDFIFNRNSGTEMLYFLNRYMKHLGWATIVSFNNFEWLIKTWLPWDVKTHREVKEWLDRLLNR